MGFAPPGWRSLAAVLKKKDVGIDAAIESGLLVKGDAGKDPYDRFRNRIVFPIKDLSGRILGFGGRVMGEELPKYVNTSETPVYRKGDFLFGMDVAAPYIREEGQVILVEGYLDVIPLHQAGIRNVVGVLGTALTPEQARRIKRLTTKSILIFDSDKAGKKAALRSGMIFLEEGFTCLVVPLEMNEDPDSFLRKKGTEELLKKISDAIPIINFAMEEVKKHYPGDNVESRAQVLDAITPYLAKIRDRAKLGVYLREVADDLRIEQHDLRAKLTSVSERKPGPTSQEDPGVPIQRWEELLVHIMIRDPSTVSRVREVVNAEDFSNPAMSGVVEKIYSGVTLGALMDTVNDNLKDILSGWALDDPVEGKEKALEDCLHRVAVRKLDNMIQETTDRLENAAEREDDKEYRELTEEWKKLQDKRRMKRVGEEPDSNAATEKPSGGESRE
jgi:DNA primase